MTERGAGACRCGHGEDACREEEGDGEEGFGRLLLPGFLFAAGLAAGHWPPARLGPYPGWAALAASYLLCGLPLLRAAAAALRRRDFFNEFTLMSLTTLTAVILGDLGEAAGVALFYSFGEILQEKAAGRSRRSIRALLASRPELVRVRRDGRLLVLRPEEVAPGSLILIRPGEKIPLDGRVAAGCAQVDASPLTGESVPALAEKGSLVYGGCLCLDGDLEVETSAPFSESLTARILNLVEAAAATKSRGERFITAFSRRYTPAAAAAALLVAVLPPLLAGGEWREWIHRALVLLVCSCPCALLLSVPLAFFAGIGAASRHGVLVKGGQVFDALARARTVIFDKTGTLTAGRPALSGRFPAAGVSADRLLRLAALAESRSAHPAAAAILAAAGAGEFPDGVNIREFPGRGVAAATPEGAILAGNARLLRENGVVVPEDDAGDRLAVHVALNGAYQGRLELADRLKPASAAAVAALRRESGVTRIYLLTGDREPAALAVLRELGLDGCRAGLLPEEKAAAFRELSPDGRAVFVGDGVNDAPTLAASGVGVAMGALGSAAAAEAADAVILDDSPARLPLLFRLAARTRRVAGENIAFALAVKAAVLTLGTLGLGTLWEAVFADVGVALLTVLNSLRAARGLAGEDEGNRRGQGWPRP